MSNPQTTLRPGLWLLCVAMPMEAELLIQRLAPAQSRAAFMERWPLYKGEWGGQEVALLLTGMGLVNSAAALAACLEHMPEARALINLGCAGAYAGSGLQIGDAALADGIVLADHGVRTSRKLHGLEKTGIPLLRHGEDEIYNRLPCHGELSARVASPEIRRGVFACVAQVSGDPATAAMVEERWGAMLEDMESGAAAQVAALYGLPFACVRGVSNLAGARELDVKAGAEAAQKALFKALGEKP